MSDLDRVSVAANRKFNPGLEECRVLWKFVKKLPLKRGSSLSLTVAFSRFMLTGPIYGALHEV
jgi:hypothetical protein